MFKQHTMRQLGGEWKATRVMQDSKGWIWLGAEGGLFRYDGLSFQPIALADTFANAGVTALFESEGMLWAGFDNGAIGYVPLTGNFPPALTGNAEEEKKHAPFLKLWTIAEGLPRVKISAFATDNTGARWIATYGEGLYVYKNNRLYQFNAADDGLASDDIYALAADGLGRVWAATDAGISVCAMPEAGKKNVRNIGIAEGLTDVIVTQLKADNAGNIWIGTHDAGVLAMDANTFFIRFKTTDWTWGKVSSLAIIGSREVWIGTEHNGVVSITLATGQTNPLPEQHQLRHAKAYDLCKDREGLLWAVFDKGALYSANTRFGVLNNPLVDVQALLHDRKGRFWAGCQSGLFLQRNANGDFVKLLSENVISIWEAPQGDLWVGTFGNGVFVLDAAGKPKKRYTEQNGLANGSVLSIGGDASRVWLASLGGVSEIRPAIENTMRTQHGLGSSYVYKVFTDSKGRVWFGTDGKGLAVLDGDSLRFYTHANQIELKTIYSITEDKRGCLWFSTHKSGLFCFDGQQFQQFTTANGLHSQRISGLESDGNGMIVIAYEDGFDLLNPGRVNHFMFCDENNGAPKAGANLNALARDAQGSVWIGGKVGILRCAAFDEKFVDDPQPGITAVSVLLQSVDFQNVNRFSYGNNYFIFNFAGLWFTNPDAVRYRYKLDGFDPDWKVSKDHLASYPNLPPGRYTFRVQTSEHGNFENVPEASWSFVIEPPWWQQWWFVLLTLVLITGLLMAYVRVRERRLDQEAQFKREKVESEFETLKSQINPHFLFNSFNTLITIIEENPKIAVEYVEHLSDFYRKIIAYREYDFISLQEEMDLVGNFSFLIRKRYEEGFQLINRINPADTGRVMPLALQMLVENAVKHNIISASKPLTVEIYSDGDGYVTVRNNIQKKIKPEPSTRFGLQSLVKRYQLLGERPVLVADNVDFFTVKVPIKHG